jgi:hypothetical protein
MNIADVRSPKPPSTVSSQRPAITVCIPSFGVQPVFFEDVVCEVVQTAHAFSRTFVDYCSSWYEKFSTVISTFLSGTTMTVLAT